LKHSHQNDVYTVTLRLPRQKAGEQKTRKK